MGLKKRWDELSSMGERIQQETPPFFKKLRAIGLVVAAIGTSIVMAPIALPALLTTIGGYLIVGGSVLTTISQATVEEGE
jgi:hypothetical protein